MKLTFSVKKNEGKKLSSTILLIKRHAKQRKAIYPTSSLQDDKVGHEKNFEIQTTSEDILRRTTQDIVGNLQTLANTFLDKYVNYNPIQPVVPDGKGLWKKTRKQKTEFQISVQILFVRGAEQDLLANPQDYEAIKKKMKFKLQVTKSTFAA